MKKLNFNDNEYSIEYFNYQNKRRGILLVNNNTDDKINCTINIDTRDVVENQVIIKNYDENLGIYDLLIKHEIIKPYSRRIPVGLNFGLLCNLNK